MRVSITAKEKGLEEQHAGGPHRRRPAEPRQDQPGNQWLNLEKKECAEKDSRPEQENQAAADSRLGSAGFRQRQLIERFVLQLK